MRDGLRRGALVVSVGFWAILLLVSLAQGDGWTGHLSRLAALGGLGLTLAGARDGWTGGWEDWGSGTLVASALAASLWGIWSGSAWALVGVLAPIVALAASQTRSPVGPEEAYRWVLVGLAVYLALAPSLDGLFVEPAEPSQAQITAGPYEAGETSSVELGQEGTLALTSARADQLPRVDLVSGIVRAETDVPALFASSFQAEGSEYMIPTPTPFLFTIERHKHTEVRDLEGDWTAVSLSVEEGSSAFLLLREMEGNRQVFVYEQRPSDDRLQLVPPFETEWDAVAGYRFAESGDNAGALRALDRNVTVDGRTLDPPVEAVEELETVGEYETPGPGLWAVLAAGLAAAWRAGRESRRA